MIDGGIYTLPDGRQLHGSGREVASHTASTGVRTTVGFVPLTEPRQERPLPSKPNVQLRSPLSVCHRLP